MHTEWRLSVCIFIRDKAKVKYLHCPSAKSMLCFAQSEEPERYLSAI